MTQTLVGALADFRGANGPGTWAGLPFFRGSADRVARAVDARAAAGAVVLPPAGQVFAALGRTPLDRVRVVVIGQDPYPTPGNAHGLAFSYKGDRKLPPSLKAILAEATGNAAPPASGDLTSWADQGVLLLNTALTVESGLAGAHLKLGWDELARDVVSAVSEKGHPSVFMLWGGKAREMASLVDATRHLVLECGHPSPLNRHRDFKGCGHFATANSWLSTKGRGRIAWEPVPMDASAPPPAGQARFAFD